MKCLGESFTVKEMVPVFYTYTVPPNNTLCLLPRVHFRELLGLDTCIILRINLFCKTCKKAINRSRGEY